MRKVLLTLISFVALSALVACGGGSSSNTIGVPSSPSGGNNAGFSNASLSGNYVYTVNGLNQNNSFAVAGVFTADGNGNVTTGVRDTVNDAGGQTLNESITGSYAVNQDGRGQLIVNGGSGQTIYRFVLQSTTSLEAPVVAKLFQDGDTGTTVLLDGVGKIEAQTNVTSNVIGGTSSFAVRLDGEDSGGNIYGAVGNLILSGGGVAGTIDENDNGGFNGSLALSSGNYGFSPNGRGTLSYITPGSTAATANPQGSHNFVAYAVTPDHLEVISTDPKFWLHGSADLQSAVSANTAAFTGSQVFALSGADSFGQRVEIGRMTLDGAGGVGGANAIEDINNASGFFSGVNLTGGSYTVGSSGRWTASLVNIPTPTAGSTTEIVGWQISPQQSVVLTSNSNILETGTMRAQTLDLTNASISGNYAQNVSGINSSSQNDLELVGNLLADGAGNFTSGTFDSQTDSAGLTRDAGTSGTYAVDPVLGRSTSGNIDGLPVVIYTLDANTVYFISAQQFDIYQGMLVKQQ
jgi:hypothetical protein